MEELDDQFCYVYSSSLEHRVQIKIGTLEGQRERPEYDKLLADPLLRFSGLCLDSCADLIVNCQIFANGKPLSLPTTTSYKAFTTRWNWNEWVTLGVQFSELPRNAVLCLTVYDSAGPGRMLPVGGTSISLFGKYGVFRQGMFDLRIWLNREADCNWPSTTPGKSPDQGKDQMQRLSKLAKKHRNGHISKVDWLDRLTFREIEMINEKEKRTSEFLYLTIEFPTIFIDNVQHSIVYYEQDGDDIYQFRVQTDLVSVPDSEILQENLVESKHHKLSRSVRSGVSDRDAKPNAIVRDQLNNIVRYPPTKQLSSEEQDLVWKFRFYLSSQKKALTKFLKCVNWKLNGEVRQALVMLMQWAPMDVEDALELLSPNFTHPTVRRYAVTRLKEAPDDHLLLYLLQLVQALKYENFDDISEVYRNIVPGTDSPNTVDDAIKEKNSKHDLERELSLSNTADQMAASGSSSTIDLQKSDTKQPISSSNSQIFKKKIQHDKMNMSRTSLDSDNTDTLLSKEDGCHDLASFLIYRASMNSKLANFLYWYLIIECEDPADPNNIKPDDKVREMYLMVLKTFSYVLAKGTGDFQKRHNFLKDQQRFIDKLVKLVKTVVRESGNRKKKTDKLQQLLSDSDIFKFNFVCFDPIPLPLDPDIIIKGMIPPKASLFKSALMPSKLTFITKDNKEYVTIFKYGDDLRQDQLILQMITLMDKLLRKENLDLKLTPYKVLATSTKHGFLQFIDSYTVAEVLATEGSIQAFFRKYHPHETAPYGIAPEIMDTYIRSCAGYCVITYLLGVGDRHLDNLLLTTSGKLFHIDFGYILGRDPKPLPPPMKLSKEMVEAMGGAHSEHHQEFRKLCYTAFLHLRRHANLMLNLFSLMVDASVPDIALEPDKAVKKVQDKLRLDLGDEEAVLYMQNLLDLSVTAVMAALVEQLHKFAQYWRK
uniref:Phosphatidylinositol 3-kinase catalytic subunit type 3 n=1 Tax=Xenopsylla cheopis TaxID=163159 RepID=A0A6M2DLC6_XENCH